MRNEKCTTGQAEQRHPFRPLFAHIKFVWTVNPETVAEMRTTDILLKDAF